MQLDDTFDGDDGFDWESAVQSVDAVAEAATRTTRLEGTQETGNNSKPDRQPTMIERQSSVTNKENSSSNKGNATNSVSSQAKSTSVGVAPGHKTLVSLRPEGWNNGANMNKKVDSASACAKKNEDPLQAKLPRELCFHRKCVEPVDDGNYKTLLAHANLTSPLKNGWTLFPHQVKAIEQSLAMRRSILALDMGLGKTVIGCVWAHAFLETSLLQCKHVLVVCPVSLQKEWKRTAEEAVGLGVSGAPQKQVSKKSKPCNATDESQSSDDEDDFPSSFSNPYPVSIHSWGKVPSPPKQGNYVVVADEAHMIQSMQSARTASMLGLALHKRCIGVLLLTGTPMKNGKPSNLFPLLKAVRHPLGKNQKAYEAHFCEGRQVWFGKTRSVWQATGSSNLEQLRGLTKSHMLHMSKDDCLKNLPPKTRVFEKVPVSSRQQLHHDQAMQELVQIYQDSKARGGESDAVLGAFQKLRLVGSLSKVDATVQYAIRILQQESAIVIFTSFQEPARLIRQKLVAAGWEGELLTGETPPPKRQTMVDKFQNGLSPVFVCTFGAGGVGLTLTAARTIILMDRPWTPGDAHQAEGKRDRPTQMSRLCGGLFLKLTLSLCPFHVSIIDRVRRIGQVHPVKSIWMRSLELDERIDDMIEHKSQTNSAVLTESGASTMEASQKQRVSIFKLLDEIMQENHNKNNGKALKQTSILQFSQPTE